MVSFVCDSCQTTLKKKKAETHRCSGSRTFSCIDCSGTFDYTTIRSHNTCITEAEKVQGSLFKGTRLKEAAKNGQLTSDASQLGEKRGRTKDQSASSTHPEAKKVQTGASWEENNVSKIIIKMLGKKPLMMNKLRRKLNKKAERKVGDSEFAEALCELGSYLTLSKTVISGTNDDDDE